MSKSTPYTLVHEVLTLCMLFRGSFRHFTRLPTKVSTLYTLVVHANLTFSTLAHCVETLVSTRFSPVCHWCFSRVTRKILASSRQPWVKGLAASIVLLIDYLR